MRKNNQNQISVRQKAFLVIFGVFLSLVILEIGLRVGGFVLLSLQEYKNRHSLKQKGVYRIMCLGESTTQIQYPGFLEGILNQRNIGITFSVIDKGLNSTNTNIILSQLEANLDTYKPDMVVTMMGINDTELISFSDETVNVLEKPSFFRPLKVSKLLNLLWLHIAAKTKEIKSYSQKDEKQYVKKTWLGGRLKEEKKFSEAEEVFKKTLKLNPKNELTHVLLGILYKDQRRIPEAEEAFKKTLELNSKNAWVYIKLGIFYRNYCRFSEAEQAFKKGLECGSHNDRLYLELGTIYLEQGKLSEAEQLFKKVIGLKPKNYWAHAGLASVYLKTGNNELFKEYMDKAGQLNRKEFIPGTINNYLKVKKTLDKKSIRLVCVQYPMRNTKPLKEIFEGQKGVIFVDNEGIFKDTVKNDGYKAYFRDMFAGDFGHCTPKGNRLLAENIAQVILKEVFNK
ncbi:MAG: tetratricopeptide repeat protein [Candidatus Omnitrophota bacterium]|nr:tetratricopeptide repeat protein [Candidatus Omnitrophota bacterium]